MFCGGPPQRGCRGACGRHYSVAKHTPHLRQYLNPSAAGKRELYTPPPPLPEERAATAMLWCPRCPDHDKRVATAQWAGFCWKHYQALLLAGKL